MRPDMHEVLIERPRSGWRLKSHRGNKPRVGEWDGEDGFHRHYAPRQNRTKWLSDLISPLERWLRSQAGRPWNKVWSELCSGIDTGSVVGRHLMDHARGFVDMSCRVDEARKVWTWSYDYTRRCRAWMPADGLYVNPATGLLCWRQPKARRRSQIFVADPQVLRLQDGRFLLQREGIWYVAVAEVSEPVRSGVPSCHFRWMDRIYAILQKRQLNSRELRSHNLTNNTD